MTARSAAGSGQAPLIEEIRRSVIGGDELIETPFGVRPAVYADYTASGRSLSFIEDYLRQWVLPWYANTHTESSGTGLQTSRFRDDARTLVARSVGAGDDHAVLFCGSGSTAAIDKLIGVLGIRLPSNLADRPAGGDGRTVEDSLFAGRESERPVVFIGPFEHHSNELPWRESVADVVTIDEDADGHIDLEHLAAELDRHADRVLKIGSFSAASNVTGIVTDTRAVSGLLHEHGALAFWDFAAAAPYVEIDMGAGPGRYDAVFISPHKFIGGPGTPGVLVARRELFTNRVPVVPGGGTVAYVNPTDHDFLDDIEHREEGGTPDIVGSIRAGLVFQLKDAVGADTIKAREETFVRRAIDAWDPHPNLQLLGSREAERLSIVSFVVRDRHEGWFLHHNFVVALLNDLFGIQCRGGCSCAGPYGHRLLHIDLERSHHFEREINRGCEGIKPGWVRVNFNYFVDDATVDYIIEAVLLVAEHGHRMLPHYRFEPVSGLWEHRDGPVAPPRSLLDLGYGDDGRLVVPHAPARHHGGDLTEFLDEARNVLELGAAPGSDASRTSPVARPETSADFEALRWFPYPDEAEPSSR